MKEYAGIVLRLLDRVCLTRFFTLDDHLDSVKMAAFHYLIVQNFFKRIRNSKILRKKIRILFNYTSKFWNYKK